ncbi:MAG: FAD-dependent oxidoreductase, partial [Bacillota bacterium]
MAEVIYKTKVEDTYSCDVLVVGGGPAGIASAIASARAGADTILIEKYGFVGGSATASIVGPFMTCYDGSNKQQIIKGIFDELITRMEKAGGAIHASKIGVATPYAAFIREGHHHVTPFDPECLKLVAEQMLVESGVKLLYYTQFIDCVLEGKRIKHVIAAKKEGLCSIQAKCIVDCTGDADIAAKAGVPVQLGAKNGVMQPATMVFRVCNVNSDKFEAYVESNMDKLGKPFSGLCSWVIEKARENGDWNIKRDEVGAYKGIHNGEWRLNTTRITSVDGTKSEELTRASIEGRKQVQEVLAFLRKYVPGFENAWIMDSGGAVGIRETRHIIGEYVITRDDVVNCKHFEDAILLCSNSIDIHSNSSKGEYVTVENWYEIPFRSLVPKGCDNLLVAGRSISADSEAVAAFRVMPCCFGIGQAAGSAAAICVKNNIR